MPRFWAIGIVMETTTERIGLEGESQKSAVTHHCGRHFPLIHSNMLGRQIFIKRSPGEGSPLSTWTWDLSLQITSKHVWDCLEDPKRSKNHNWVLQWRKAWKKRGSGLWDRRGAAMEAKKNQVMWNPRRSPAPRDRVWLTVSHCCPTVKCSVKKLAPEEQGGESWARKSLRQSQV